MASSPLLTPKSSSLNLMWDAIPPSEDPGLPDHTQLPESDGTIVKNFQELPQSIILTSSIEPILKQLHPDGQYCIGQDSGIYWQVTHPPLKGCEAPDWFYVAGVPPYLNGDYRRSYVMWKEQVIPVIAIEFVSGNGDEERDYTPAPATVANPAPNQKAGKFWVYEQAIKIPFYAIYEVSKASVEVYHLVGGRYQQLAANTRGHYEIPPMGVELGIRWGQEDQPIPWLRWWDCQGNLLLTGAERAEQADKIATQERQAREQADAIATQERQAREQADAIATQERQEKEKLAAYLRALGINPDEIT